MTSDGSRIPICPTCNKVNSEGEALCSYCGARVEGLVAGVDPYMPPVAVKSETRDETDRFSSTSVIKGMLGVLSSGYGTLVGLMFLPQIVQLIILWLPDPPGDDFELEATAARILTLLLFFVPAGLAVEAKCLLYLEGGGGVGWSLGSVLWILRKRMRFVFRLLGFYIARAGVTTAYLVPAAAAYYYWRSTFVLFSVIGVLGAVRVWARWVAAVPIIVLEDVGVIVAIRRSVNRVKGREFSIWMLSLLLILFPMILGVLGAFVLKISVDEFLADPTFSKYFGDIAVSFLDALMNAVIVSYVYVVYRRISKTEDAG